MIDYSGKIPDGIYENKLPYGFNKYVPFGNHFVPGAYDACLNLDVKLNATTIDPDVHKSIVGRWHLMQLKANVAQINKTDSGDPFQAPLDRLLTEGLSYKLLIDSAFSMPAGLETKFVKNAVSPRYRKIVWLMLDRACLIYFLFRKYLLTRSINGTTNGVFVFPLPVMRSMLC